MKRMMCSLTLCGALFVAIPALAAPCDNSNQDDACMTDDARKGLCMREGEGLSCVAPVDEEGFCDDEQGEGAVCYTNDGDAGLCEVTGTQNAVTYGCFVPGNTPDAPEPDDPCDGLSQDDVCTTSGGQKGLCEREDGVLGCATPFDEEGYCSGEVGEGAVCYGDDGSVGRCEITGTENAVTYGCFDPNAPAPAPDPDDIESGCATSPTGFGSPSSVAFGLFGLLFGLLRRRR